MSLGKAKTHIKEGVKELQSVEGIKHAVTWLGLGVAIGVLIDLLLEYIVWNVGILGGRLEVGFKFYTGHETTDIAYDDVILIIITIALLFTKKLWLTVGFFIGWYCSSCSGLYGALGLPHPTT